MRIIDPQKLQQHRELIDGEVTAYCLSLELSRPESYRLIASELGQQLSIRPVGTGWWHGLVLPRQDDCFRRSQIGARRHIDIAQSNLTDLAKRIHAGEIGKADAETQLEKLDKELSMLIDDLPRLFAGDILELTIVGVKPDSVATALLLRSLDEHVDLFLDSDTFEDLYPNSEWYRLFPPAMVDRVQSESIQNEKQLLLFDSEEDRRARELKHALGKAMRSLAVAGPSAALLDRPVVGSGQRDT